MDIGDLMKQAAGLQQKMQDMQAQLEKLEVEGAAGGGLVKCVVTGKGTAKSFAVDPSLMREEEREVLEDLIVAAFNDAKAKAEHQAQTQMQEMTQGLPLPPGMKLPF
ncbi:MAG: YbaB/EbfC family nucleoid-associated protein [Parvularculaceae bacterium]